MTDFGAADDIDNKGQTQVEINRIKSLIAYIKAVDDLKKDGLGWFPGLLKNEIDKTLVDSNLGRDNFARYLSINKFISIKKKYFGYRQNSFRSLGATKDFEVSSILQSVVHNEHFVDIRKDDTVDLPWELAKTKFNNSQERYKLENKHFEILLAFGTSITGIAKVFATEQHIKGQYYSKLAKKYAIEKVEKKWEIGTMSSRSIGEDKVKVDGYREELDSRGTRSVYFVIHSSGYAGIDKAFKRLNKIAHYLEEKKEIDKSNFHRMVVCSTAFLMDKTGVSSVPQELLVPYSARPFAALLECMKHDIFRETNSLGGSGDIKKMEDKLSSVLTDARLRLGKILEKNVVWFVQSELDETKRENMREGFQKKADEKYQEKKRRREEELRVHTARVTPTRVTPTLSQFKLNMDASTGGRLSTPCNKCGHFKKSAISDIEDINTLTEEEARRNLNMLLSKKHKECKEQCYYKRDFGTIFKLEHRISNLRYQAKDYENAEAMLKSAFVHLPKEERSNKRLMAVLYRDFAKIYLRTATAFGGDSTQYYELATEKINAALEISKDLEDRKGLHLEFWSVFIILSSGKSLKEFVNFVHKQMGQELIDFSSTRKEFKVNTQNINISLPMKELINFGDLKSVQEYFRTRTEKYKNLFSKANERSVLEWLLIIYQTKTTYSSQERKICVENIKSRLLEIESL